MDIKNAPWNNDVEWTFGELEEDVEKCCRLEFDATTPSGSFEQATILIVADEARARSLVRLHMDEVLKDVLDRPEFYGLQKISK